MPEADSGDLGNPAAWEHLVQRAGELGANLTPEQVSQLRTYLDLLVEWNQRFNLTAVRDPDEILTKHFFDSLTCASVVDFTRRRTLLDVGTGAGFPGMVLKIAFPHLNVTLMDAVHKRLGFLERVAATLGLQNVSTAHVRAEDAAGTWSGKPGPSKAAPGQTVPTGSLRGAFDVVTARAVARLNVLSEWILPFARVGGVVIAMKGPEVLPEVSEAENAIRVLGGEVDAVRELMLPGTDVGRSLVVIRKVRRTPAAYPRRAGTARKTPL